MQLFEEKLSKPSATVQKGESFRITLTVQSNSAVNAYQTANMMHKRASVEMLVMTALKSLGYLDKKELPFNPPTRSTGRPVTEKPYVSIEGRITLKTHNSIVRFMSDNKDCKTYADAYNKLILIANRLI